MAELGKKYCVYCLAEVSSLRFRCTECADIELCPDCFSAGAEIGPHRRWHGYQLVDGGRFTLWGAEAEGGWSSREEQLLLDAIEQFGFGNWVRAKGGGAGCRRRGPRPDGQRGSGVPQATGGRARSPLPPRPPLPPPPPAEGTSSPLGAAATGARGRRRAPAWAAGSRRGRQQRGRRAGLTGGPRCPAPLGRARAVSVSVSVSRVAT